LASVGGEYNIRKEELIGRELKHRARLSTFEGIVRTVHIEEPHARVDILEERDSVEMSFVEYQGLRLRVDWFEESRERARVYSEIFILHLERVLHPYALALHSTEQQEVSQRLVLHAEQDAAFTSLIGRFQLVRSAIALGLQHAKGWKDIANQHYAELIELQCAMFHGEVDVEVISMEARDRQVVLQRDSRNWAAFGGLFSLERIAVEAFVERRRIHEAHDIGVLGAVAEDEGRRIFADEDESWVSLRAAECHEAAAVMWNEAACAVTVAAEEALRCALECESDDAISSIGVGVAHLHQRCILEVEERCLRAALADYEAKTVEYFYAKALADATTVAAMNLSEIEYQRRTELLVEELLTREDAISRLQVERLQAIGLGSQVKAFEGLGRLLVKDETVSAWAECACVFFCGLHDEASRQIQQQHAVVVDELCVRVNILQHAAVENEHSVAQWDAQGSCLLLLFREERARSTLQGARPGRRFPSLSRGCTWSTFCCSLRWSSRSTRRRS
jgi:hypothetical protein